MNQGDIWLINLDPAIGAEIKKTRPSIVINDNILVRLPLKIIIPITDLPTGRQDGKIAMKLLPGWFG
jgi:mRNA interferase MazF